jgi:hypothetical protein
MKKYLHIWTLVFLILGMACSSSSSDDDMSPNLNPPPTGSTQLKIVYDDFEGSSLAIIGSSRLNFIVAFDRVMDGKTMNFTEIQDSLPIIMKDDDGSHWTIFGQATDGPNEGKKILSPASFMGYWFSWGTFYPGLEIFDNTLTIPNVGASVSGSDGWSIPRDEVYVGASKEAIPSIDDPEFIPINSSNTATPNNQLNNNELVVLVNINGNVNVYPHNILNWHEIVNDEIDDTQFALVFCPLTGTSTVWDRKINGTVTTFGVSGFLYNSNVVPYDRTSRSNWSQILLKSVNGTLEGNKPKNIFAIETNYATARIISNDFQQMTKRTGFSRDYNRNPYGNYPTNSSIMFPINFEDDRLPAKERVLGIIIGQKAKAYRFTSF